MRLRTANRRRRQKHHLVAVLGALRAGAVYARFDLLSVDAFNATFVDYARRLDSACAEALSSRGFSVADLLSIG